MLEMRLRINTYKRSQHHWERAVGQGTARCYQQVAQSSTHAAPRPTVALPLHAGLSPSPPFLGKETCSRFPPERVLSLPHSLPALPVLPVPLSSSLQEPRLPPAARSLTQPSADLSEKPCFNYA